MIQQIVRINVGNLLFIVALMLNGCTHHWETTSVAMTMLQEDDAPPHVSRVFWEDRAVKPEGKARLMVEVTGKLDKEIEVPVHFFFAGHVEGVDASGIKKIKVVPKTGHGGGFGRGEITIKKNAPRVTLKAIAVLNSAWIDTSPDLKILGGERANVAEESKSPGVPVKIAIVSPDCVDIRESALLTVILDSAAESPYGERVFLTYQNGIALFDMPDYIDVAPGKLSNSVVITRRSQGEHPQGEVTITATSSEPGTADTTLYFEGHCPD